MNIVDPKRYRGRHVPARSRWWRSALLMCGAVVALATVTNLVLLALYRNRTYPKTMMGAAKVGSILFDKVAREERLAEAIPKTIVLEYDVQKATIDLQQAGQRFDAARARDSLAAGRSWLPIVAIFTRHQVAVPVAFNDAQLDAAAMRLTPTFNADPLPARIVLDKNHFTVADAKAGYDLNRNRLRQSILNALDEGHAKVAAPVTTHVPTGASSTAELKTVAQKLEKSLSSKMTYTYGASKRLPSAADIAQLYKPSGNSFVLDDFTVRTYIASVGVQMGVHARDLSGAVAATETTLASGGTATVALQAFTTSKTYHYCVASRGTVPASEISGLKAKLASTYADLRGWSLDGQVQFAYATSDCDFTVWLTSADQMPSFGAICDTYWNCEVNNNVVVNADRWQNTSDAWKAYGGTLEDYRVMLINHETGHMLGFQHLKCPGQGQPAPVMMQQSIDLGGCVFNIWPTAPELAALRQRIGL